MKKVNFFTLGLMSLGFLLIPSIVSAKEIEVQNTDSISTVIASSTTEDGDVLVLADGTYTESFTIDKDLTLKGSSAENVIIDGKIVISADVMLDNITVKGAESEIIDIAGNENGNVSISNCVIQFKNLTENDYGKANWVSGVRLSKTANGTKLSIIDTKISAQYAVWVNGEENTLYMEGSTITGWAALDISNGTSATTQANNNTIAITDSTLTGISYNAESESNAYGTIVIGGQSALTLAIENSTIQNKFITQNAQDLIVFGDAYLPSKDVVVLIAGSSLINNDTQANSYVYNWGTTDNSLEEANNAIALAADVEVTSPDGQVNAQIPDYVDLTVSVNGEVMFGKFPAGEVLDRLEDPEAADGYTFDNWYADPDGNTPFDFTQTIDENTTIYALFTENQTDLPDNPQTGDNLYFLISMAVLSFTGLFFISKKVSARNHA